jgi:CRP/FNR family transcriptional regulator
MSAANIDDVGAFHHLSEASKSLLARGLRDVQFPDKATVLKKGQRVSGAYVVVSGKLRIFTISPDGNEATLYMINPGETCVLALNCIFNDLLYPAWVEASPATKVAVIPGAIYRALFDSEPAIRDMTVQAFSTLVFRLMSGLEEIHSCKLEQRLANLLLLHASTDGNIRMTQQEIASHLGATREVVARVLGQLASEGHIQTGRNQIVINDPVSLAEHVKTQSKTRLNKGKRPNKTLLPKSPLARRRG